MVKALCNDSAPRNWAPTLMFSLTFAVAVTAVPWYAFAHGYYIAAWAAFTVFLGANGMAITCGYHRLFAHGTYEAHPALKLAYLLCGAMALQNSALIWSANHRTHHRFIDDPERDPYCARRGFWFSHIGWMLRSSAARSDNSHDRPGLPISSRSAGVERRENVTPRKQKYVTPGDAIQQKQLFFPDFGEINAVTLLLRFTTAVT